MTNDILPPLPAVVLMYGGQPLGRLDRGNEPSKGDTVVLELPGHGWRVYHCVGRERFYGEEPSPGGSALSLGEIAVELDLDPGGAQPGAVPQHRISLSCDGKAVAWTVGTTEPAIGDLISADGAERRRWRCIGVAHWYSFYGMHADGHTVIFDHAHTVCQLVRIALA